MHSTSDSHRSAGVCSPKLNWHWIRPLGLLLGLALLLVVISCGTFDQTLVMPPTIPGATYVGDDDCAQCHEPITRVFHTATHARLKAPGTNATHVGCESCHGPGSLHSESGGAPHTIVNPQRSPEVCFQCHLDKRGEFQLPSRHPVLEGKMTCTDCHESHKGPATPVGSTSLFGEEELCVKCHIAQRGPFVYHHEATREGCSSCHAVHGSVNNKMLLERNATLCMKCHFQRQTGAGDIIIGGFTHGTRVAQGTCWSAGCHEAVHGSQVNSSLRF